MRRLTRYAIFFDESWNGYGVLLVPVQERRGTGSMLFMILRTGLRRYILRSR